MQIIETTLPGVLIIEPPVYGDDRGFFMETWHTDRFRAIGIDVPFLQDNHSFSVSRVLRGLHFQEPSPQGKLVRAVTGAIFDVAVDIRRGSPAFGKWVSVELTAMNKRQLWVPPGFAHGFCVLSNTSDVIYKCTAVYDGSSDRSLVWNDPDIAIEWPVTDPILSPKDAAAPRLANLTTLPEYS